MPARANKQADETDITPSKGMDSAEMSFDVAEWLEGERLEHERRMQELGCSCTSTEKLPERPRSRKRKE
jgi:hypothetical protein